MLDVPEQTELGALYRKRKGEDKRGETVSRLHLSDPLFFVTEPYAIYLFIYQYSGLLCCLSG